MRKKAVPVGIEDFERIVREDYYYVDKTQLIEELLINRAPVTLFTRNKKLFENLKISNSEYMSEQGNIL